MVNPIPESVKKAWDNWNIRGIMLFSLSLQAFLILFAPFRMLTANRLMIMFIWSTYLLADWAANFGVGLITDSRRDSLDSPSTTSAEQNDLLAFWATFLLIHLGGPDTITAFALEDNELWLRHFFGLIFQTVAAFYVFLLSFPVNKLFIPTILTFVAGSIKYLERTCALYLASLERFRDSMLQEPDPGINYVKIMEEFSSRMEAKIPTEIFMIPEPARKPIFKGTGIILEQGELGDLDVVHCATYFFKIFKGLVVDLIFSFHERNESRFFFYDRNPLEAYRIIEVELNLFYEIFYTKAQVIRSVSGYVLRFVSFCSVVAALAYFHLNVDKRGFHKFDIKATYVLMIGAICLDTIAVFMLVFSDRTFAALKASDHESRFVGRIKSCLAAAVGWFFYLKRPRWRKCPHKADRRECRALDTCLLVRRWSGSFSGQNLLRYCLKGRPTKVHRRPTGVRHRIGTFITSMVSPVVHKVSHSTTQSHGAVIHVLRSVRIEVNKFVVPKLRRVTHCLRMNRIVNILNKVAAILYLCIRIITHFLWLKTKTFIKCLGIIDFVNEMLYVSHEPLSQDLWNFIFYELKKKSKYEIDTVAERQKPSARGDWIFQEMDLERVQEKLKPYLEDNAFDKRLLLWHIVTELLYHTDEEAKHDDQDPQCYDSKEFSRLLSDYLLYLLIMKSAMLSDVAGIGKIRFRDTIAEANRFFEDKHVRSYNEIKKGCEDILCVNTYANPSAVKGDRSKSLLFEAAMLAKDINSRLKNRQAKWNLVSKMWVELASFAASGCDARSHAQQLSRGGELITFVWLLMSHFGLGEQFQISNDQGRATLIVGK